MSDVDIVESFKYLGVVLDKILEWTTNMEAGSLQEGPELIHFLRRLQMFYQSAVGSFSTVVFWSVGH